MPARTPAAREGVIILLMSDELRYWVMVGVVGWTAVTVIAFADIGLQRVLHGAGFVASPREVARALGWVVPGAALSVVAVPLLRYLRARSPAGSPPLARYVVCGIGYWLGWSILQPALRHVGVAFSDDPVAPLREALLGSLAGNAFNSILLFGVLVALIEARAHRRAAHERELRTERLRGEVARAQTAALAARLDPHFLFNTLHVASGLMQRNPASAREVLNDLRALIEGSLGRQESQRVPLDDELRLVERYLRIQAARFGDRLSVEMVIGPESRDCRIPPLLLQPLVENAVQHGIGRNREGGRIRMTGGLHADRLRLEVTNTPGGGATIARSDDGLGLAGIRARLQLLYGDDAWLHAGRDADGEFRAIIELPATPDTNAGDHG